MSDKKKARKSLYLSNTEVWCGVSDIRVKFTYFSVKRDTAH